MSAAIVVILLIAWFFGPRSSFSSFDPLTGQTRRIDTWLGQQIGDRFEDSPMSIWATQNMKPHIYPGSAGWRTYAGESRGEWFGGTWNGSGGDGPKALTEIYSEAIQDADLDRVDKLHAYQSAVMQAHFEQPERLERIVSGARSVHE